MEFNKIIRGAKREKNDTATVYAILDAGFLCHVAFQFQGQAMIIPTAYGRLQDVLYFHGSAKNFMLNQIADGQTISIAVTHLDGIVLAKSLFHTSVNYRSVIVTGKAELVSDEQERMLGMQLITENIVKGRWNEVRVGDENQIKATLVVKVHIERASAKIRNEGPVGDDDIADNVWSGIIPLSLKASLPMQYDKLDTKLEMSHSVKAYYEANK